jgi:hypothetical protein
LRLRLAAADFVSRREEEHRAALQERLKMSEIELMRQAKQFEYANLTIETEFDDLQQTHEKYAAYLDTLMTLHLSEK